MKSEIVDINAWKEARRRLELQEKTSPEETFGDRLQRIRSSLEKINHIMADLRRQK